MRLSVVMPVYNEKETVQKTIENVLKQDMVYELIVVDDCSDDGTREMLQEMQIDPKTRIIFHNQNKGKGGALRTAFKEVKGDAVVIQDADCEYDPVEYKKLIAPIERGDADVVYGSRLSGGCPQRAYMFWHRLGNGLITLCAGILYNTTLSDIETGYKMFLTPIIKEIDIKSNGFAVEPEITAKILKNKKKVYEVPIAYYGRTYEEGKKIFWYHGIEAIWTLLKYRFMD